MTPKLGLIEWVKNTTTIKDFLEKVNKDIYKSDVDVLKVAQASKRDTFYDIGKVSRSSNLQSDFANHMPILSSNQVTQIQELSEAHIPWNLLRSGLEAMTRSPEAFLYLQSLWTKSLAAISAAHYILGIGDRHLSNTLINCDTGSLVGIDFGMSFGISLQFLHVPELIPFRLSRQFRHVFLPHDVTPAMPSPFSVKMATCLRAWRAHTHTLGAMAEVFVNEPSTDWESLAKRLLAGRQPTTGQADPQTQSSERNSELARVQFYPRMKLATAKRKLRGAHPVAVMRDELDQRPNPKFKKDWKKLAEGEAHSVRAKIKCAPKLKTDSEFEEVICVEDQVKCLIDLATDVNLLGRLWVGWESHV